MTKNKVTNRENNGNFRGEYGLFMLVYELPKKEKIGFSDLVNFVKSGQFGQIFGQLAKSGFQIWSLKRE